MKKTSVVEIEDITTWEETVEQSKNPVIVMFYSPTCPHCKVMEPYYAEYAQEFSGKVFFARINIIDNPVVAAKYGVMGTPTFKFFCEGRPMQELVGEVYPALVKKIIEDGLRYGSQCVKKATWINVGITGYA